MIHKHAVFDKIKKEMLLIMEIFLALVVILKIVYYHEGIWEIIKITLGIFWLFVIPGYAFFLYWIDILPFLERLIYGAIAALGIMGVVSYLLGLYGVHIRIDHLLIPACTVIGGITAGMIHFKLNDSHKSVNTTEKNE
jgi:hypothetical protein